MTCCEYHGGNLFETLTSIFGIPRYSAVTIALPKMQEELTLSTATLPWLLCAVSDYACISCCRLPLRSD